MNESKIKLGIIIDDTTFWKKKYVTLFCYYIYVKFLFRFQILEILTRIIVPGILDNGIFINRVSSLYFALIILVGEEVKSNIINFLEAKFFAYMRIEKCYSWPGNYSFGIICTQGSWWKNYANYRRYWCWSSQLFCCSRFIYNRPSFVVNYTSAKCRWAVFPNCICSRTTLQKKQHK